ncbi:MAG: phosphomannomutase [Nitrospirae bacterium]|jgi:phosphomannomutase|nr:phosphomannomutase [Nitrospirota bacterium]
MLPDFNNAASCWKEIFSDIDKNRNLLTIIEKFARENTSPSKIVFGTSGWRGEIGSDFTFNNVRIVTSAIVEMFKNANDNLLKSLGVKDFEDVTKRGIIVGHDNRFLGKEFAMEVIGILQKEGIKTWYAGEAPTPQFSAGIEILNAACSINLTPSHNPANYAGFKFNPSDGGPAGPEITSRIEEIANLMMKNMVSISHTEVKDIQHLNLNELYLRYLNERKTIDLIKIKSFIDTGDCFICVDNVHGSTRGCLEKIIGINNKTVYLRTEDDYLFGGVAPEPSEKNMQKVDEILKGEKAKFRLGVIMDPDGDRIRFSDGNMQIPMNYFGAMAFHYLHKIKGIKGIVAKSVGTSNLVNAVAEKLGVPVRETKVGFKNFRPFMLKDSKEKAIVAFEESDGISGYNHTLEKDALFGFLLALEIIAVTGKNLSEYLKEIMDEFGYYYPDRSGVTVSPEFVGEPLLKGLAKISEKYKKGSTVTIGNHNRIIKDVITVDGTKLVFDDGSWFMIRPSGTEPKVRFYIEARTPEGKKDVFNLAEKITNEALLDIRQG